MCRHLLQMFRLYPITKETEFGLQNVALEPSYGTRVFTAVHR